MRRLISRFATHVQLWFYRRNEVARFDGIILTDLKQLPNRPPHFRDTLLAALHLLKSSDLRRFN